MEETQEPFLQGIYSSLLPDLSLLSYQPAPAGVLAMPDVQLYCQTIMEWPPPISSLLK